MTEAPDDGGLDVIVHSTAHFLAEAKNELEAVARETANQAEAIDSLDSRADQLLKRLGVAVPSPEAESPPRRQGSESERHLSREAVSERAALNLQSRGIDPAAVKLEELIDAKEVARIQRRFEGSVGFSARLDRTDLLMAIVAGLVGGLVDTLVVRTPATSQLTETVKKLALPSDNWLAGLAKVPYDIAWNEEIWLTPRYHRVQTVGHDPLLGLITGTADILRQTCTGIRPDGTLAIISNSGDYPTTWPAALGRQILHTLSDVPTKSGVPLPGWAMLAAIPTDSERNLAQKMYAQGYDSWHFLTMATAPASVELLCRGYWAVRRARDEEFAEQAVGPVADQPRYQAMTLVAHGVSAGVDFGAFLIAGSNPLTLNYAQWIALAKKAAAFAGRDRPDDPSAIALANQRSLDTGWPVSPVQL